MGFSPLLSRSTEATIATPSSAAITASDAQIGMISVPASCGSQLSPTIFSPTKTSTAARP